MDSSHQRSLAKKKVKRKGISSHFSKKGVHSHELSYFKSALALSRINNKNNKKKIQKLLENNKCLAQALEVAECNLQHQESIILELQKQLTLKLPNLFKNKLQQMGLVVQDLVNIMGEALELVEDDQNVTFERRDECVEETVKTPLCRKDVNNAMRDRPGICDLTIINEDTVRLNELDFSSAFLGSNEEGDHLFRRSKSSRKGYETSIISQKINDEEETHDIHSNKLPSVCKNNIHSSTFSKVDLNFESCTKSNACSMPTSPVKSVPYILRSNSIGTVVNSLEVTGKNIEVTDEFNVLPNIKRMTRSNSVSNDNKRKSCCENSSPSTTAENISSIPPALKLKSNIPKLVKQVPKPKEIASDKMQSSKSSAIRRATFLISSNSSDNQENIVNKSRELLSTSSQSDDMEHIIETDDVSCVKQSSLYTSDSEVGTCDHVPTSEICRQQSGPKQPSKFTSSDRVVENISISKSSIPPISSCTSMFRHEIPQSQSLMGNAKTLSNTLPLNNTINCWDDMEFTCTVGNILSEPCPANVVNSNSLSVNIHSNTTWPQNQVIPDNDSEATEIYTFCNNPGISSENGGSTKSPKMLHSAAESNTTPNSSESCKRVQKDGKVYNTKLSLIENILPESPQESTRLTQDRMAKSRTMSLISDYFSSDYETDSFDAKVKCKKVSGVKKSKSVSVLKSSTSNEKINFKFFSSKGVKDIVKNVVEVSGSSKKLKTKANDISPKAKFHEMNLPKVKSSKVMREKSHIYTIPLGSNDDATSKKTESELPGSTESSIATSLQHNNFLKVNDDRISQSSGKSSCYDIIHEQLQDSKSNKDWEMQQPKPLKRKNAEDSSRKIKKSKQVDYNSEINKGIDGELLASDCLTHDTKNPRHSILVTESRPLNVAKKRASVSFNLAQPSDYQTNRNGKTDKNSHSELEVQATLGTVGNNSTNSTENNKGECELENSILDISKVNMGPVVMVCDIFSEVKASNSPKACRISRDITGSEMNTTEQLGISLPVVPDFLCNRSLSPAKVDDCDDKMLTKGEKSKSTSGVRKQNNSTKKHSKVASEKMSIISPSLGECRGEILSSPSGKSSVPVVGENEIMKRETDSETNGKGSKFDNPTQISGESQFTKDSHKRIYMSSSRLVARSKGKKKLEDVGKSDVNQVKDVGKGDVNQVEDVGKGDVNQVEDVGKSDVNQVEDVGKGDVNQVEDVGKGDSRVAVSPDPHNSKATGFFSKDLKNFGEQEKGIKEIESSTHAADVDCGKQIVASDEHNSPNKKNLSVETSLVEQCLDDRKSTPAKVDVVDRKSTRPRRNVQVSYKEQSIKMKMRRP